MKEVDRVDGSTAAGRLAGRVAIVTGGGRGIGRALAGRLAREGAHVAVLDVTGHEEAARELAVHPGQAMSVTCDVSEPGQVREAVGLVADRLGGIDILVNNAGLLSGRRPFLEVTKEEMLRYYEVNVVGQLLMAQACFERLRESSHRGRVVNVASRTAFTAPPGQLAYVAGKGAVLSMTRVLAREMGRHGITVNAAMPSQVATPGTEEHSGPERFEASMLQQAIQEYVRPDDLAGLVAFLVSDDARMITGQAMVCDGGGLLR